MYASHPGSGRTNWYRTTAATMVVFSAVFSAQQTMAQSVAERIPADEPLAYRHLDETSAGNLTNLGTATPSANTVNDIANSSLVLSGLLTTLPAIRRAK